jgi:hypothetical protein
MRINIPETRPADNVRLSPDYPQEEEFALANMTLASLYHFFYFPEQNDLLYDKYVRFEQLSDKEVSKFQSKYKELLAKASINSDKERVVIKNPVNTSKIPQLLMMFPDAQFVYIYRNPVSTYISTCKFFISLLPTTALKKYDSKFIKELIIKNYQRMMRDYLDARNLIPKENLIEIRFEDFDQDNLGFMERIYTQFEIGAWQEAKPYFLKYIEKQKHYTKNRHKISKQELDHVLNEWQFAMEEFGYDIPDNVEIIEKAEDAISPSAV